MFDCSTVAFIPEYNRPHVVTHFDSKLLICVAEHTELHGFSCGRRYRKSAAWRRLSKVRHSAVLKPIFMTG